jgi:hypothetical protein
MDLKAVKTAREVSTGILYIAYGRKRKGRVIYSDILTKAMGLRIVTPKQRL